MSNGHAGEVRIRSEGDIVGVRKTVRTMAQQVGFGITDTTRIVTAASELARNVFLFAGSGVMRWQLLTTGSGIELTFADNGLGIANIAQALQEGYTTSGGLGLGLPGARRLMDEMEIHSDVGKGTTVVVRKWLRR
jgi:serine/threonine-protein kinase RsbT